MPASGTVGDAHERQRGGLRAEAGDHRAAAGPCRASRARSSCRCSCTPAGRSAAMWVKSTSLRLALTTRNRRSRAEVGHHQVVDDAAGLVGQQRVALAAGLQAEHVAGHQALQRGRSRGAGQRRLAHVRDVEQRGLRAAVQVLGQHALVLHRHGIAGELHHAGAEGAVPGVERGGLQRLGRGVVRQRILDHWFAPQRSPAGDRCRSRDPPLSRNLKD